MSISKQSVKRFGYWSIVLLAINSIIGTGIFLNPKSVILLSGTWAPVVYIGAAVFACVLAVTFASAAKYTRKNGAAFAYSTVAFGDSVGLYIGITRFVAGAIAWGVMATAVVSSTIEIFMGKENKTFTNVTIGFLLLMAVVLGIIFSGTYVTKIFSNLSTVGKVAALAVAIIAGLVIFIKTGENHMHEVNSVLNDAGEPVVKPMNFNLFITSVIAAFYAFTGFESVASAASEMEEPEKNLPKAIPVAIGIIALVYVGIVTSAMLANPVAIMQSKDTVGLASAYSNPWIKNIITYGAVLSMFGINIAAGFSTPRVFEAMVDEGHLPSFLSKRSKNGVPVTAFIVTAAMAIIVPMAFHYDMQGIMIISSISRFAQFLVVPMAVIVCYKGMAKKQILQAKGNVITDVIVPILGFLLTVLLLAMFSWRSSFSLEDGSLNYYAISAMIFGYVILPLLVYIPYKAGKFKK